LLNFRDQFLFVTLLKISYRARVKFLRPER